MSWPWSWWKRQYLSLDLLLGSPFSLLGKFRVPSSLICIRTWSIGVISGVKFVNFPVDRLSSLQSPVLAIFHPLSCCVSSCFSLFLGFSPWAKSASFAFMYLDALYSTSDIVFESFLYRENRNLPFRSPFVKAATSILSLVSSIDSASLLKRAI